MRDIVAGEELLLPPKEPILLDGNGEDEGSNAGPAGHTGGGSSSATAAAVAAAAAAAAASGDKADKDHHNEDDVMEEDTDIEGVKCLNCDKHFDDVYM